MRIRFLVLILIFTLPLLLSGCSAADEEMLNAFILDYVVNHLDNIAARKIFGGSGDEWVDATFDIKDIIDNLNRADKLMDEGIQEHDPEKMDEAVNLRPDDWSLRTRRASYALALGDVETFQEHFDHANGLFDEDDTGHLSYLNDAIAEFEDLESGSGTYLGLPGMNTDCPTMYTALSQLYSDRAEITESEDDRGRARGYANQANYCP